jgi:hypothetical protein
MGPILVGATLALVLVVTAIAGSRFAREALVGLVTLAAGALLAIWFFLGRSP